MLDWAAIETALERFAAGALGHDRVLQAKQSLDVRGMDQSWVEIQHGDEMPVRDSDEEYRAPNAAGTGNVIEVHGLREFMAHFKAWTPEQGPNLVAKRETARLRAALKHTVMRKPLTSAHIAVVDADQPSLDLDHQIDGRLWSVSLLSVRLRAAFVYAPLNAEAPGIDTVELTITGERPKGEAVFTTETQTVTGT